MDIQRLISGPSESEVIVILNREIESLKEQLSVTCLKAVEDLAVSFRARQDAEQELAQLRREKAELVGTLEARLKYFNTWNDGASIPKKAVVDWLKELTEKGEGK